MKFRLSGELLLNQFNLSFHDWDGVFLNQIDDAAKIQRHLKKMKLVSNKKLQSSLFDVKVSVQ